MRVEEPNSPVNKGSKEFESPMFKEAKPRKPERRKIKKAGIKLTPLLRNKKTQIQIPQIKNLITEKHQG